MRLAHLHIPHAIPFTHASLIQQTLVTRLLAHKKQSSPTSSSASSTSTSTPVSVSASIPDPTIFTFTPHPVYTTGRRDLLPTNESDNKSNSSHLILPPPLEPIRHVFTSSPPLAEFHPTLRGGQTTYHGPGQLVAYTILDLRRFRIGPRAHIRLLEDTVLDVLGQYNVRGILSDDPGVWVAPPNADRSGSEGNDMLPRKVAAVGVHLRRFVSSYGVGLNVTNEPMWFLKQIVACGLEGREATSLEGVGVKGVSITEVAERFVRAFVQKVNEGSSGEESTSRIEEVYKIEERDVLG